MTGAAPHVLSDGSELSQPRGSRVGPERSFRNVTGSSEHDALSALVSRALWSSFPEEHSEEGVADAASPYFRNKTGDPISARTVRYWLRGETLPSALHIATLVRMQPKIFLSAWLGVSQ